MSTLDPRAYGEASYEPDREAVNRLRAAIAEALEQETFERELTMSHALEAFWEAPGPRLTKGAHMANMDILVFAELCVAADGLYRLGYCRDCFNFVQFMGGGEELGSDYVDQETAAAAEMKWLVEHLVSRLNRNDPSHWVDVINHTLNLERLDPYQERALRNLLKEKSAEMEEAQKQAFARLMSGIRETPL